MTPLPTPQHATTQRRSNGSLNYDMAIEQSVETPTRSGRGRVIGAFILVALVVLLASLRGIVGFYTDYLWFDDLGRAGVWASILRAKIVLAVVFIGLFFVLSWLSLFIADRNAPPLRPPGPEEEVLIRWHETLGRRTGLMRFLMSGIFALFIGSTAASQWNEWILFTNRIPFDLNDPVFDRDLGFYMFRLPFLTFVIDWFFFALVVIGVLTALWYWINGGIRINALDNRTSPQVKAHISVILAFLAAFKAGDYYFQRFGLLGSRRGFAQGAFYTDLNASLPAIQLLLLISLFSVGLFVINIFRRGWTLPAIAVGLWALVAVVAGGIYPAAIQALQVAPSEEAREAPYIERNIEATRLAFGLDSVETGEYNYSGRIDTDRLTDQRDVFSNVRLLDPRIVDDSFTLTQRDRQLYRTFAQKVDVDRYVLDGELTPVVVGVRQLASDVADTWERRHAVQTHGYGIVVAPANRVNPTGQPDFIVSDAPLDIKADEFVIDQPQIYFGDAEIDYALVNTTQTEFDPIADDYSYDGTGGLPLDSFWRRFSFAVRFGELEPMISGIMTPETEVLFNRDVTDRARRIAPFLHYDSNPYPIVVDGGVSYIIDAYTTSDRYPYSEEAPITNLPPGADLRHSFNYLRNSVKVLVDAYDGTVDFYVVDPEDPILRAYQQAFDTLFHSIDEMPQVVRDHLRYPEDMFRVQTEHWGLYHLQSVREFYTPNFGWDVAHNSDALTEFQASARIEQSSADSGSARVVPVSNRPVDPYYQVTRLPDEETTSFILSRPYVPRSSSGDIRELTAYFMARTDTDGRPELRQYLMTTGNDVSVRGPAQIDEALNADPEISEESTELGRGGSQFLSGNLIVLLVDEAVVYVRPFYVRSQPEGTGTTEPLIEFVAAVRDDRIGFAPTYAGALSELFDISLVEGAALAGTGVPAEPNVPGSGVIPGDVPAGMQQRLDDILAQFAEAEAALPDFAEYERLLSDAIADLEALSNELADQPAEVADPGVDEPAAA